MGNVVQVSLVDFWDMLNRHDWFYTYSDDHSVYRRGQAHQDALEAVSKQSPEHAALFKGFHNYHFSGKPWNTPQEPKPERPSNEQPEQRTECGNAPG